MLGVCAEDFPREALDEVNAKSEADLAMLPPVVLWPGVWGILQVAAEVSVPVVNAFAALGSGDQVLADKYLEDGVHFTAEGNRLLFKVVQEAIIREFPELDPASERAAPRQGPHWSEVDPMNPRESVLRGL